MPEEVVNTKKRPLTELEIINKISRLVPGLSAKGIAYVTEILNDMARQETFGI